MINRLLFNDFPSIHNSPKHVRNSGSRPNANNPLLSEASCHLRNGYNHVLPLLLRILIIHTGLLRIIDGSVPEVKTGSFSHPVGVPRRTQESSFYNDIEKATIDRSNKRRELLVTRASLPTTMETLGRNRENRRVNSANSFCSPSSWFLVSAVIYWLFSANT